MGGRERQLLSAPGDVDVQDVLADGRVLVADVSERHVLMVWTPEHPEGRDFTWMDWAYGMRFSADGTEILFGDQHSGDMYGTFLRNLDGSPAVRLGDGDPLDISADGKWAISRLPVSPDQLELLPTGAGTPRQLTHSNVEHLGGRFFPDGRIVAYGNEPGHRERAYLVNLDGSEKPLTPEGFLAVASTGDGKRVLTVNLESREYRMMAVDGGPGEAVPQLIKGDIATDFTPGDAALLVRRTRSDGAVEFWRVELPSGKRTLLRTIPLPESAAVSSGQSTTVSRDGKSYGQLSYHSESTEYVIEGLR
jgi:hypothetical protein